MANKIRADIEENDASFIEEYAHLAPELAAKLSWFQDQKLGVIFHWGLYSEAGIVESWQLSEADEWARKKGAWRETMDELRTDYWNLNKSFNPVRFNPEVWAQICKQAGFRYMLFTTKHHDGFNMYDTQYSDYKITAAPSAFASNEHADVFKYVVEAFRAVGISTGAYYSKPDWHSPYYWVKDKPAPDRFANYNNEINPDTWDAFKAFVQNQLLELTHNYGKMDILWLDGGWVAPQYNEDIDMDTIVEAIRVDDPDILVVDRAVGGQHENYVTPERKIPDTIPKKVWESNIPLAKNWGYVPNDIYKSFEEILYAFIQIVAKGGNLILGVGPKPDGTLPEEAQVLLHQLGDWLDTYGEGIYDTRPYTQNKSQHWHLTTKDDTIYAFCINDDATDATLLMNELQRIVPAVATNMKTGKRLEQSDFVGELVVGIKIENVQKVKNAV